MIADAWLDAWLERWEELADHGGTPSVDEFLASVTDPAEPELAEEFRRRVRALGWVAGVLKAGSGTGPAEPDAAATPSAGAAGSHDEPLVPDCGRYRAVRLQARGGLCEVFAASRHRTRP